VSLTEVSITPAAPSMAQRAFCSSACTILQAKTKICRNTLVMLYC
jgi:hypothetical protein